MRVLVVEDDRKVAGFIQKGLGQEGYAVDVLHEGHCAAACRAKATVKDGKGETAVPLEGKALGEVAHLKAGEKVMLTCRDNAQGEHQAITAITPAK